MVITMVKEKETEASIANKQNLVPWYNNKYYRYSIGTILLLTIFYLMTQLAFIIAPVFSFFSSIFAPIVISLLFYYILRPIVYYFEKLRVPRVITIFTIYLILALLLIIFTAYVAPKLAEQVSAIANTSVEALNNIQKSPQTIALGPFKINLEYEIQQRIVSFLQEATTMISQNLVNLIGIITRVATILLVIPFILFYLLKEDNDFSAKFLDSVPGDFGREVKKILKNIDSTLSSYINGLILVSCSVGCMLFIGYLMIGLNYALILSIIALVVMTIPFLGPFLAITPALLIGISGGPLMILKVAIVFIIVQQIESNIISPQIIGQRLHIHPLTIILLLLAAGTLYGLVGLLLATPVYAVSKVLAENLFKIYRLRYPELKETIQKIE
ncbi:MAG: AI-2E family transporter [Parachlamydiaceae bacterium]|nr:AI-2E family transporter [Parachlamydiaceae bacterium]